MDLGLPDRAIDPQSIPWVPLAEGIEFKLLRSDFASGAWVNLIRIQGGGQFGRHRHNGGAVLGYCLEGEWNYLERDWIAKPGTFVYEPPGDIHTLQAGKEGMTTLFVTDGVIQYVDEHDETYREDNVFSRHEMYQIFCEQNGYDVVDLCY